MASEEKRSTDLSDNDEDSGNDEPPYKEGRDPAFVTPYRNGPNGGDDPENSNDRDSRQPSPAIEANDPPPPLPIVLAAARSNDRFAIYENAFLGDRPDPQPPRNLRQFLNALTEAHEAAPNPIRQIVNHEVSDEASTSAAKPGNTISALPVEVLLVIFSYLDDISLCHVGEVCKQWNNILDVHTPQSLWQRYTRTRWPLYHQITNTTNWFKVCIFLHVIEYGFSGFVYSYYALLNLDLFIIDVIVLLSHLCYPNDTAHAATTRKSFSGEKTAWRHSNTDI